MRLLSPMRRLGWLTLLLLSALALPADAAGGFKARPRNARAERVFKEVEARHHALKYDKSSAPPAERVEKTAKAMLALVTDVFPGRTFDPKAFSVEVIAASKLPARRAADVRAEVQRTAKGAWGKALGARVAAGLARLSSRVGRRDREGKLITQGVYFRSPASVFILEEFVRGATDAELRQTVAHELTHALLAQNPSTPQPRSTKKLKLKNLRRVLRALARDALEQVAVDEALADTVGSVGQRQEQPGITDREMIARLERLWDDPGHRRVTLGEQSKGVSILRGFLDNRLAHHLADGLTHKLLIEQLDEAMGR